MNIHLLLSILAARWRVGLGVFLACVAVSAVITFRSPRLFTATAQMVVDLSGNTAADAGGTQGAIPDSMQTHINIITSPRVADLVVEKLGFDKDPAMKTAWQDATKGKGDFEGWLAEGLIGSLTVVPPVEGNVVNVSATWSDPAFAAKIANYFVEAYIRTSIDLKVDPAKQASSWLDQQGSAAKQDLEAKQKKLSDYLNAQGIVSTNEGTDSDLTRLGILESQLATLQRQRADSRSRARVASDDSQTSAEVLQNGQVAALRNELFRAEQLRKEQSTQLGANHPDRLKTEATIAKLNEDIRVAQASVASSLRTTEEGLARQERELQADIAAQKVRAAQGKRTREQAAILQSDVTAAQNALDRITQGYARSSLESETTLSNASILTAAKEPSKPSSPKYKMNFMMGFLGGLALGIAAILGLEKIDQRLRIDSEIPDLLGVPLLATFSSSKVQPAAPLLMLRSMAAKALGVRDTKALPNWSR